MRALFISVPLAALTAVWMSSVTFAGGWAVTTLDPIAANMQAGETYAIGYTIRQHGVVPLVGGMPQIRISQGTTQLTFRGRLVGERGHYISDVIFPTSGEWTWFADPIPFGSQSLGTIRILPPRLARASNSQPPIEIAMMGLTLLVVTSVGAVLAQLKRNREAVGGAVTRAYTGHA